MEAKVLCALPVACLLAACGGSSTSNSPTASFTTLRAFSDGAGVGRGVASDGREAVFISPDIAEVVAEANRTSGSAGPDLQFSDFAVVETLPTALIRQGSVTVEGEVINVVIVEDNGGRAGLIYLEVPGYGDAVFATGSAYGSAPSGQFTYNGAQFISDRYFGGEFGVGGFTLTADFTNRTFNYSGSTASNPSIGSSSLVGSGTIDTVNGRFASNNMSANISGVSSTASMYGQLHGNSAQSVSGVFHTNESDPFYAGAFVGSRP